METTTVAVIPAAGFGTRFLPATKAVPKELLPIIQRPAIEFILDDIVGAGIPEVVVVNSKNKAALTAHLSRAPELETHLESNGSQSLLQQHQALLDLITISYTTQEQQLGLGHAVLQSEPVIGDRPFAVLLPDDIIFQGNVFLSKMLQVSYERGASVLALKRVPPETISRYGVVSATEISRNLYEIHGVVEKPKMEDAPSDLAVIGRYILSPSIFGILSSTKPGALGEVQLTDAIAQLIDVEPVYGVIVEGEHFDVGTPEGMLMCALTLALEQPHMRAPIQRLFGDWSSK